MTKAQRVKELLDSLPNGVKLASDMTDSDWRKPFRLQDDPDFDTVVERQGLLFEPSDPHPGVMRVLHGFDAGSRSREITEVGCSYVFATRV